MEGDEETIKKKKHEKEKEVNDMILYLQEDPKTVLAKTDLHGNTLLHISCCDDNHLRVTHKIVELLPTIDLNMKNLDGRTPLHFTAMDDRHLSARFLIEHYVNLDLADNLGNTALHLASENGSTKVMELLVSNGASINIVNKKGDTALHTATWNGQIPCVGYLLMAGIAVDLKNGEGKTALFVACDEKLPEPIEFLLRHGADEKSANKDGKTILKIIDEYRKDTESPEDYADILAAFDKGMEERNQLTEQAIQRGLTNPEYRTFLNLKSSITDYLLHLKHTSYETIIDKTKKANDWNRLKELIKQQNSLPKKPLMIFTYAMLLERIEKYKHLLINKWQELLQAESDSADACQSVLEEIKWLTEDLTRTKEVTDSESYINDKTAESIKEIRDFLKDDCQLPTAKAKLYADKLAVEERVTDGISSLVTLHHRNELQNKLSFVMDETERKAILYQIMKRSNEKASSSSPMTEIRTPQGTININPLESPTRATASSNPSSTTSSMKKESVPLVQLPPNTSIPPTVLTPTTVKLPPGKEYHVFLTHNWAKDALGRNNHDRVSRVNRALQSRGFITWFDEEQMTGQIRQTMANALYKTAAVLCFLTKIYESKINSADLADNCLYEFNIASNDRQLVNCRIPIAMEKTMLNPNTWERARLHAELGGELILDMTEDGWEYFEKQCEAVAQRIITVLSKNYK